jgi:GTP-binding protein Era
MSDLTPTTQPPETRYGRVALLGRPNAGKSTLLNTLIGERLAIVSPHPQTTRDVVRGVRTDEAAQYLFVDTPGLHEPRSRLGRFMNDTARAAAHDADAVVLVVDAQREPAADAAALAQSTELPERRTILALSKIDRLQDKAALLPLLAAVGESGRFRAVVPISARKNDGIDRLLGELLPLLPLQPKMYDAETLSDQPARFFVAELVREQVLRHTRQEIPHGVAVLVERFDDSSKPVRIEASVVVAREAHQKILIGAGGRTIKTIGTDARARIERMLGEHVHIELRVRAARDWMNDDARLRELGYGRSDLGDTK